MGELIRTTRNTFDLIEAKLASVPEVLDRLKGRAKILAAEVRFTVDPNTPDALALAKALDGHGETGRTGTALDRIRVTCLGQTGAAVGTATPVATPVAAAAVAAAPARVTLDTTNAPAQMLTPFKKSLDDERAQLEAMLANVPAGTPEVALQAVRARLEEIKKTAPTLAVTVTPTPAPSAPPTKEKEVVTKDKEPATKSEKPEPPTDSTFKAQEFVPWRELVGDLADKVGIQVSKPKKKKSEDKDE